MPQDVTDTVALPGAIRTERVRRAGILPGPAAALYRRYRVLFRYAMVGGAGYAVYIGLLVLLYDLALLPFLPEKHRGVDLLLFTHNDSLLLLTTLIGTQASIVVAFAGHTAWTFAGEARSHKPLWRRFAQFQGRALISTLGVLTLTVNAAALAGVQHYVAVALSLAVTFTWNWLCDSKIIWRKDDTA